MFALLSNTTKLTTIRVQYCSYATGTACQTLEEMSPSPADDLHKWYLMGFHDFVSATHSALGRGILGDAQQAQNEIKDIRYSTDALN